MCVCGCVCGLGEWGWMCIVGGGGLWAMGISANVNCFKLLTKMLTKGLFLLTRYRPNMKYFLGSDGEVKSKKMSSQCDVDCSCPLACCPLALFANPWILVQRR